MERIINKIELWLQIFLAAFALGFALFNLIRAMIVIRLGFITAMFVAISALAAWMLVLAIREYKKERRGERE